MDSPLLIFGKSWTGKTARLLKELESEPRAVLVDPKCGQLMKLRGWEHVSPEYDEASGRWTSREAVDALRVPTGFPFRVCFHFRYAHREQLELLCQLLVAVKNCALAVDELSFFVPPAAPLTRWVTSAAVSGTHDGIKFAGTAQRLALVHPTLRANAARMLFYRQTEKNDLDAARNYLDSGMLDLLSRLEDHVCIDYRDGGRVIVDASYKGRLGRLLPGRR